MDRFDDRLDLDGASFELVCVRRSGVAVYRGDRGYLRLGTAVASELAAHREMLERGYPVADILEVGVHGGSTYFLETSLGTGTIGDACAERGGGSGQLMSSREFSAFRGIMTRWAHAQLTARRRPPSVTELADFLGVTRAVGNVPRLAPGIREAFGRASTSLGGLPATMQHGDLHPFNVCRLGVIDLEGAGWAPAGYDVATAVFEPTLAEANWVDGRLAVAWFSHPQLATYFAALDEEFLRASLPWPSTLLDAHLMCRAIARCSHVHREGVIQSSREDVLERLLSAFLAEGRVPIAWPR
jgi:hypothetical protein